MPPSPSQPPRERRRAGVLDVLGGGASWLLALVGLLCLLLTAWALAIGARPLVVKTGSMAPQLPVGTVALVRPQPAAGVAPGDVVAVRRADGVRIMHRVRRVSAAGGGSTTLVLRGDRNRASDPPVTVRRVERPVLVVPGAGRPLTWLGGRWAQYWLGVATGVLALAWVAIRRGRAPSAERGALHA
jgi:signal peptidase